MANMNAIDVSLYQTIYDANALKQDGIKLCMIKASQGRYLNGYGSFFKDRKMDEHAQKCVNAHLPIGFYHFLCAFNVQEAKQEAKKFLKAIKPYAQYVSYVALDCENYNNTALLCQNRTQLTESCNAFLKICADEGYLPMLYTNPDHLRNKLYAERIKYPLWVAQYGEAKPQYDAMIMWQKGPVSPNGITANTDGNICYIADAALAVLELAEKGFMASPTYWINQLDNVKWLPELFIQINNTFNYRIGRSKTVEEACNYMKEQGAMNSPEYWIAQSKKVKHLADLLKNFGGGRK